MSTSKPRLVVGWLIASHVQTEDLRQSYEHARDLLLAHLEKQFTQFDWQMPLLERPRFSGYDILEALDLLELGAEAKLFYGWDYALVLVPNELEARTRISTLGVPSSALEVGVLSSASLTKDNLPEAIAALAQHLLGHLFTLDTRSHGPMKAPDPARLVLEPFDDDQAHELLEILEDVADTRLEERKRQWNSVSFYWQSFVSDWRGTLKSIWGYKPWRIPLYLGRMTAAVIASLLFLLLTAEAWEAGAQVKSGWLSITTVAAIFIASTFIFFGQNLSQVGRGRGWSEQLARSRIVLFGSLLFGMIFLWLILFILLSIITFILPETVIATWAGYTPETLPRFRFVAFMASVGILAAALGGNLEEEDEIKARFFFDEEL